MQLGFLRFPGWPFKSSDEVPKAMLTYIANQLNIGPKLIHAYSGTRETTRREHLAQLRQEFGFRSFGSALRRQLSDWLLPMALRDDRPMALVTALLDEMRARKVIIPALHTVEALAVDSLHAAEETTFDALTRPLNDRQRQELDKLITFDDDGCGLTWLRHFQSRPTPSNFLRLMERLSAIREIGIPEDATWSVHQNRLRRLAREGGRHTPQHLHRFQPLKRYAFLVALLSHLKQEITDQALEMHDALIGRLFNRSEHKEQEALQQNSRSIHEQLRLYAEVGKALVDAYRAKKDLLKAVEAVINWDRLAESVGVTAELLEPTEGGGIQHMRNLYPQYRQYSPTLLRSFDFKSVPVCQPLLKAIGVLKELDATGKRKLPLNAPTAFVRPKWEPHVFTEAGIDRCYYELCVLTELRNGLRSGDVWVDGSRRFADFEGYLIPKDAWEAIRARGTVTVDVNPNFQEFIEDRREKLHEQLERVSTLAENNELPGVQLGNGRLHFTPLSKSPPEQAETWAERTYDLLPRIKLTDLLVEVDGWTAFSNCFTHLHSGSPATSKDVLFAAIMADATNQGLTKMAEASPGLSYERLCWTADWHIREETYSKALAELVNRQHRLSMAERWGDGTTSSSDGQAFPIATKRPVVAQTNAKYGRDPVVMFYTHISGRYAPYHTKAINSTARDAPYVLDGLLGHEADLRIREHYTDTAGFTDQVFAACSLLGFRFAPRIRDLGDQRLYTIAKPKRYPTLRRLIGGTVRVRQVEQYWDEILRLASSIRLGTVTASLILNKLASYPRQNGLAQALRELGRIERTLFMLDWIEDPDLRQRATIGLNKGEARNTLARAVFFYRRGAVRDRLREDLQNKASALNLMVAAIILWNTVYLNRAVQTLADQGTPIPEECLPHVSPLGWEHINFTGDYVWNLRQRTTLERLRPLRKNKLPRMEGLAYSR